MQFAFRKGTYKIMKSKPDFKGKVLVGAETTGIKILSSK